MAFRAPSWVLTPSSWGARVGPGDRNRLPRLDNPGNTVTVLEASTGRLLATHEVGPAGSTPVEVLFHEHANPPVGHTTRERGMVGTKDMDREARMAALRAEARTCPRCHLAETRMQVVFGEGSVNARIMVVGQGPGIVEDETGRPFVGPAGALLDRALAEVGLTREQLWITNVIKCRATKEEQGRLVDRPPLAAEVKACRPWLEEEIGIVQPQVLVCLGTPAAQVLIRKGFRMGEEHGRWHEGPAGVKLLPTFHPAYVLRLKSVDPEAYHRTWQALVEDLGKAAMASSPPL